MRDSLLVTSLFAVAACPPTSESPSVAEPKAEAPRSEVQAPAELAAEACEDTPTAIKVAPCLPKDIAGGAAHASLSAAATFAWQEFIALNWPAVDQTGAPNTRGVPFALARLENINLPGYLGRLPTWMTFRHKIEIFPGAGAPPPGVTPGAYDDLPRYIYNPAPPDGDAGGVGTTPGLTPGQIPMCKNGDPQHIGGPEDQTFLNADEANEIGLAAMFAGVVEKASLGANGSDPESASQILYMVKANRTYFDYVVSSAHGSPEWWKGIPDKVRAATIAYLRDHKRDPEPGSATMVSFPDGTIITKSAWRRAIPAEIDDGRHLVRPVRRYKKNGENYCYAVDYYTLIALHIIQKTPSAPSFIYATFEHADNLLTADGRPIEDEDGAVIVAGQPAVEPAISATPATPQHHQVYTPSTAHCTPGSSLYYENNPDHKGVPQGKVCLRGRLHPIPPAIIEANRAAHAALDAYAAPTCVSEGGSCFYSGECCSLLCSRVQPTRPGRCLGDDLESTPNPTSVLRHYKLVNVQAFPVDKPPGATFPSGQAVDPSTYYLANIVVESNYGLQVFSGGVAADGTITDYDESVDPHTPFYNTYAEGHPYNMGGCMGCHGVAQHNGGGFSFMFDGISKGLSNHPDAAVGPGKNGGFGYAAAARWAAPANHEEPRP